MPPLPSSRRRRLAGLLAGLALAGAAFAGLPAIAEGPAADFAGRPLRVGVAWLPPPDTPDMRLYMEEGFEIDLAGDLARALAAELRLERVAPDAAAAALREGRIDAVVTRAAPDDPLRRTAQVLETGFSSGLSVAMRSDRPLRGWEDLKGRVVCASEANARALDLAVSLGAQVKVLRAPAVALMSVRTGACDAAVHDRALLDPLFGRMSWQKFSATLPARGEAALVVAVATGRPDVARAIRRALDGIGTPEHWAQRRDKWASTVSFEVYRDQVAADCH